MQIVAAQVEMPAPLAIQEIIRHFHSQPGVTILEQNGLAITAGDLLNLCEELRARVSSAGIRKYALVSTRTDTLIAALLVAASERHDLILLRSRSALSDELLASWNVDALLDETLSILWQEPKGAIPEEARLLIPTSGTTGPPKLALHSFEHILSRVRVQHDPEGKSVSRWLLTYHPAGFAGLQVIFTALANRARLGTVYPESITDLCNTAQTFRPTHISGTPTFWRALLLNLGDELPAIPLRQITVGGEAIDQALLDQLHAAFPLARIVHIYASTEAGALFAVGDGRAGFPAQWLEEPVEGVRLRVREGILEVLSPRAMLGYADGRTVSQSEDHWLITGDLVKVMGDRVLFCGRVDERINVGGSKVLPEEVEQMLRELPFVRDVVVYAKANPVVGALVCADVVLVPGTDPAAARGQILESANSRLERYKVPRFLRFVTEIAVSSNGKKIRQQ